MKADSISIVTVHGHSGPSKARTPREALELRKFKFKVQVYCQWLVFHRLGAQKLAAVESDKTTVDVTRIFRTESSAVIAQGLVPA